MKRVLSMLCVLAIMLGMITVPAFAAAEGAVQQDVTVLSADAENLTVESDTYIDLNGHSIAGVTVADGATLYVSDSQTDDYDVADGIYGAVTGISGAVAAAEGYIAITEEGAVSYHKVDLTLTSMTLRPAVAGVYYNSAFAADAVVARNVVSYGVALSVAAEPTAENLDTLCGYSTITGFEEGEKSGTLLTGVMNESNTDYANDRNAAMAIYGRAYIKTAEGYTFGACASRDLKTQVEAIDTVFASLKEAQSAAILAMYAAYESVMANWDVPNIKHAAVTGDTVITVPVAVEDGEVTETVTVEQDGVSITIPFGTLVEADELTLTVTRKSQSDSGIEAEEGQTLMPFDVHVEGLSSENEAPLTIALGKVMPENLNLGNYSIYHVEADGTKEMELVDSAEELTDHNQFAYTLDGELTLNMASFSEAVAVINTENGWNGSRDYGWYTEVIEEDANATYFEIRNADQLAGLSAIVGGMDGQTADSFKGKTIKLLADISINDLTDEDGRDVVFYPIGYYNSDGTYAKTNTAITSSFKKFEGTFDGNGNTISDFYQNTWEMKGDHNWYDAALQYYRDGMGLFGKVYGGTVKNLTVRNFQSDGEIATTGVIAAYADCGATFKNIAIFDCNPRVYNIGNGGIVGAVGWYANDKVNNKVTFENITVDSSNKISALWGTYDASCGGLVGQYYPTSGQDSTISNSVHFENCHVAAEMDVNNDVCGNYQYYWYRYCGMFIGSTRENKTENGYTVANADSVTTNNCTYNIGKWNNYYYCELVANSQASYTHDHQMSRLVPVANVEGTTVTPLEGEAFTVPTTGRYNYVVVSGEHATENATCYHFVDGAVWNHADAGEETVNGATVLKEDKQHIYLPFNQLMTGYGWGVKAYQEFDGIEADPSQLAQSSEKFDVVLENTVISADTTSIAVSQLFEAKDGANINESTVHVFISPVGENSTVVPTYVCVTNNELDDIAALSISGTGAAKITITDYYFCLPTTINVTVGEQAQPAEKFVKLFDKDFLYRVGNQNTVSVGKIFSAMDGASIDSANVSVTIESVTTGVSGSYNPDATTWTNGTIKFTGTGIVKVTITDNDNCTPTVLYLEVVDATNVTGATSATSGNVVLLNDCDVSSLTVSGRYTFYGNGFTVTYSGNGQYLNNGLKQGVITVSENGTLDNLRIQASIYPRAYMYYGTTQLGDYVQGGPSTVDGDKTRYHYQLSAVAASGNATISNCYIYGGRNNVFINTGDVTIENSVLECGVVANVQIQSNGSHTVTFNDVTTIQHHANPTVGSAEDKELVMMGAGIVVGPETSENPSIVLNGDFKQYNWVTEDDAAAVYDDMGEKLINGALDATAFNHTVNGKTASNLGIIYMNDYDVSVDNNTDLPYKLSTISMSGVKGQAYSLQGATAEQIYSDYANANKETVNGLYQPQFKYDEDLGDQLIPEGGDEFCYLEGDTIKVMFPSGDTKELDLAALVNIEKYTGQNLNLNLTCKDSGGNAVVLTNNKITLSDAGTYTVTYTVTDTMFFDKDGIEITDSKEYSWNVTIEVSLKDASVPDAYYEFDSTKQKMGYYKPGWGDVKQYLPFLAGLKIYDYNGQTSYLRFDGDADYNKIASITITGYTSNEAYVEVKLTDGGVINTKFLARADSGGGSTYTGKIKTSNNVVYFVNDGGTSDKATTTTAAYWYVDYYKFTGNNGVEITSGQQTFNSTGSSASTPSGSFSTTVNYTVSYDANGGKCGQAVGYATSASAAVTLPTPTRSGYIFAGWYDAASGGNRIGGAGASYTPNANITLYAQWGKPCTVTYNANGGSVNPASEKYTGTALTLPTPTREDYWFTGWYDAASDGNKIGEAGVAYIPTGDITLYAHWQEKVEYTVKYNANGGTCGTTSATYQGTALILPTPTNTGNKFLGWYDAASGGNRMGGAGENYTPTANITLYAQWQINSYTIKVTTNNATVQVNGTNVANNGTVSVQYGTQVTVGVTYSQSNNQSTTIKGTDGTTYTSPFNMPAQDVTINANSSSGGCVTPDSLVSMADGSKKEIQHITAGEQLLVWDFYKGEYTVAPAAIVFNMGTDSYRILELHFEDGTVIRTISGHRFFDADTNRYELITEANVDGFIGHGFVKADGDGYSAVKLESFTVTQEYTTSYSIMSAYHYNFIVEDFFSDTFHKEDAPLFEYFEIGEDMRYDEAKLQQDIETYGLFTYEDFADYLTYEQFEAFNVKYMKVSVGKGKATYEDILNLIATYVN